MAALRDGGVLTGVNSDAQNNGLDAHLAVDREQAASLGVDMADLRTTLYAAYGTRQVSTIYAPEDSYQVIMELADRYRRDESSLEKIKVRNSGGALVPLGAFTRVDRRLVAAAGLERQRHRRADRRRAADVGTFARQWRAVEHAV